MDRVLVVASSGAAAGLVRAAEARGLRSEVADPADRSRWNGAAGSVEGLRAILVDVEEDPARALDLGRAIRAHRAFDEVPILFVGGDDMDLQPLKLEIRRACFVEPSVSLALEYFLPG